MRCIIYFQFILIPAFTKTETTQKLANNVKAHSAYLKNHISQCNPYPTNYGPWQKVSCYKGLQFRTVRGNQERDGTYWWSVQFRNLYSSEVRFSYNIVELEKESHVKKNQLVLDSWSLNAGADPEKEGYDSPHAGNYVRSAEKIFVFITNVRLAINGNLNVPFIKCDY